MKLIVSNTSRGAYRGVVDEIKLRQGDKNVVIAPDRFTASVERGLISSLELESTFGINVMSFTRLANKLIGRDIKRCLTPEGAVMLIGKVIAMNRDKLTYYHKSASLDGFASELYAALTAIRNSGISTDKLRENLDRLTPSLRAKTQDIILIYEGYLNALGDRHSDSSTRLQALAEFISSHPDSVSDTNFFITDIYDFSSPELDIIAAIGENARSLTVGVVSGYDNPNRRIYPDRMIARLKSVANGKANVVYRNETLSDEMDAISKNAFSYSLLSSPVINGGKVEIRRAKDRETECLALALDIIKKVQNGGRYKDVEVFVSDVECYETVLKSVFTRYNIPFFIDTKEPLIMQTKVRFALLYLAAVRSGLKQRDVIDFVKNPLFYNSSECAENDVYLFENYVLKYNIDYSRFLSPFTLNDGKEDIAENEIPEKVRRALISCLKPLLDLPKMNDIYAYVSVMRNTLGSVSEAWLKHAEKLSELSAYYEKCAEQVDDKLESVLDEIEYVLDIECGLIEFENIFKSMIKTLKISLVPTFLDCVFVGGYDSRFMGLNDVYVLGATNDKIPRTSAGGSVVTPKDEKFFERIGLDIRPNESEKLLTDMYAVLDVMKKTHGKLTVSYPESGGGVKLKKSFLIDELISMFERIDKDGNKIPERINAVDFDTLPVSEDELNDRFSDIYLNERSCYYEVLRGNSNALDECNRFLGTAYALMRDEDKAAFDKAYEVPERIVMPTNVGFGESTSVSRIEKFFSCPYSHYFEYILSLKKRKDGNAEGTENGLILHAVLEKFFKDIKNGKTEEENIASDAERYFDLAVKENDYERLYARPDTARQLKRLKREAVKLCINVYAVYKRSEFKPAFIEAFIGKGKTFDVALTVNGKEIPLRGKIDRIDILNDRFLVIDYKTYKSADISLKDIYYGKKIQLYVYMEAAAKGLQKRPVGVFYLPVFDGYVKAGDNVFKYKGQILDDEEVAKEIDSLYVSDKKGSAVPYVKTRGGVLNPDVHLNPEDFETFGNYALRIMEKGASEIASGYVKPAPCDKACDFCTYREICGHVNEFVRSYSGVNKESLNLTKEGEDDGQR